MVKAISFLPSGLILYPSKALSKTKLAQFGQSHKNFLETVYKMVFVIIFTFVPFKSYQEEGMYG